MSLVRFSTRWLMLVFHSHGFTSEGILCGRSPHNPRDVLVLSPSATGESAFLSITADDITFVLPSFAPPSLAAQCLSLPPTDPQVHALLQQLRHLEIRVEDHTRRLVSKGGKDLYRRLKPNASAFSTMTALFILGEHRNANAETHLAMHRIIIADPLHFIADPISMRTSGRFAVRSVGETQSFERVRGWVREQSEELGAFARKAAEVRAFGAKYGRKASKERWIWMEKVPDELAWSLTDVEILRFLQRTLDDERALQTHPYLAITPTIIKTVDEATLAAGGTLPYTGIDVGRHRMRAFLAELGVVAPWEDWVVHDLDNFFGVWDSVDRSMLQEATGVRPVKGAATSEGREGQGEAALSTPRRSGAVKAGYYAQDAHDSVRHDFNQLPVYTIDDAGAMELDDGISLAPAAPTSSGEPTWWVHVHVADPTALLEPAHPLARAARHRNHSEYFPEKTWSMLPEWFVQREGMSLGSQKGRVQRTLSISMRVNGKGEVLESDVKVGVVRNVKRLTYKAVDQALGGSPPAPSTVLTHPLLSLDSESSPGFVRKPRETDDSTLAADASSVADLTTLHHLANAMLQRRIAADALYWSFPQAGVSVSPRLSHRFGISPHATFPRTQPVVSLTLPNLDSTASFSPTSSPAQLLVSEMMVAANRAAARFSVEKGLPVPFRTQQAPVISAQTLQEVLACRDPRTGEASGQDILRLGVDFLPGSTKVEPGPHWPMGIKDEWGYLKVTSPLRRFSDLFAHWQIKSALLPSWAGTTAPPFTRSAVLLHIKEMDLAHKARGKLSKHAEHFWALYVLKQKMDAFSAAGADVQTDATASLLLRDNPLSALSLRDPTFSTVDGIWVQPVLVQDLGVRATLRSERQVEAPEKGEIVLVGVEDIKLGPRSRMMVRRRW